jgi:hypothetical protein
MCKARLAHQPQGNQPSRDADFVLFGFQLCGRLSAKPIHKGRWRVGPPKFPRKRFISKSLNLFEFLLPLLKLVARLKLQGRSFRRNRRRV